MALKFLNDGYFAGKVGIGIASPGAKLDVDGDVLIKSGEYISWGTVGATSIEGSTASNKLQFRTNSADRMIIDSSGNVGIGTTSPGAKLDVIGQGIFQGSTTPLNRGDNVGALNINNNSSDGTVDFTQGLVFTDNSNNLGSWTHAGIVSVGSTGYNGSLVFGTDGDSTKNTSGITEKMRITSGGNVGIGTTSPSGQLTVVSNNAYNSGGGLRLQSSDSADRTLLYFSTDHTNGVSTIQSYRDGAGAGSKDLLINPQGGNVGIGETNPSFPLHLESSNDILGYFKSTDNRASLLVADNDTSGYFSVENARVSFGFGNGASTANVTVVDGTYNVGIGTTSPDFKLDVDGTFGVSDLPFNTDSVSVLVADEITGVEEVTNGDFSNGQTGWSFQTGWAVSNGGATVSTAGVTSRVSQTLSYVANISTTTKFRYKFEITNITAGSLRLFVNKPAFTEIANVNAVGKYEYDVEVSTGSDGIFYLYSTSSSGSTFQGTVTNVSVKEITPVSNQIQKRELGTGAFGPTPVGAYLPLTAGSGSPLTGDLYLGAFNKISGVAGDNLVIGVDINNSSGASSFDIQMDGTTSAFYINNSRQVGIGTTLPGANLEIRGTVNTDDCKIYLKENSTYGAYFKYDGDLNLGYIGGITSTTSENAVLSWSRDGSELKLVTSGSTAVTIDSNRDATFSGTVYIPSKLEHTGDSDTFLNFSDDTITLSAGGSSTIFSGNGNATFAGNINIKDALLSNQENTDIDSAASEVVAQVSITDYTAAFFDFVVKKSTNIRSGTVYACHDGTNVEFTETSTNDLGDTSDVVLRVDKTSTNLRLIATVASDDWSVKSLIRAI